MQQPEEDNRERTTGRAYATAAGTANATALAARAQNAARTVDGKLFHFGRGKEFCCGRSLRKYLRVIGAVERTQECFVLDFEGIATSWHLRVLVVNGNVRTNVFE